MSDDEYEYVPDPVIWQEEAMPLLFEETRVIKNWLMAGRLFDNPMPYEVKRLVMRYCISRIMIDIRDYTLLNVNIPEQRKRRRKILKELRKVSPEFRDEDVGFYLNLFHSPGGCEPKAQEILGFVDFWQKYVSEEVAYMNVRVGSEDASILSQLDPALETSVWTSGDYSHLVLPNETEHTLLERSANFPCPILFKYQNSGQINAGNWRLVKATNPEVAMEIQETVALSFYRVFNTTFGHIPNAPYWIIKQNAEMLSPQRSF